MFQVKVLVVLKLQNLGMLQQASTCVWPWFAFGREENITRGPQIASDTSSLEVTRDIGLQGTHVTGDPILHLYHP